jgi:hypothetical protein
MAGELAPRSNSKTKQAYIKIRNAERENNYIHAEM